MQTVGCKALFIVPTLRRSDVVSSLLAALPSLSSSRSNDIKVPELPELKSIVVIDNLTGRHNVERTIQDTLRGLPAATHYNELLSWRRDDEVSKAESELDCNDVINLQFSKSPFRRVCPV